MKLIGLTLWTYAAFSLHAGLGDSVGYGSFHVHLLWLALVPTVLRLDEREGLLLAATWGLLADCLTSSPLGIDLVGLAVAATVIQRLRRLNEFRSLFTTALLTATIVSAEIALADGLRLALAGVTSDVTNLAIHSLTTGATTAVVGFVIGCAVRLIWRPQITTSDERSRSHVVTNRWRMLTG
ncbi:MAG: rod shape-determining protein MreD [Planctomycetales bacterium]|nr:rod shape-determining protein MreD [Planctomycetales bacterium]